MSEIKTSALNERQQKVVESIDGIYVVDAGAGTGKTTAITSRYEHILDHTSPENILLLTFTNNAAQNMKSKVIKECSEKCDITDLARAPISTFHSFCNGLLVQYGLDSPNHLGIESFLRNPIILQSEVYERQLFRRFYNNFRSTKRQYTPIYKVLKHNNVYEVIRKLCCKGIFPKRNGWFNNGLDMLMADFELYKQKKHDDLNNPKFVKDFIKKLKEGLYIKMPNIEDIAVKDIIKPELVEDAFFDDRSMLIEFTHDVYFDYIEHCVKMNRINFDFMIMFAFILLYHNHALRESKAFEYVMVDEFQDTNEIQFMMVLMLMKKNNLCAVGDWKQGIYAFRNATIDNILEFDNKLKFYKDMLNMDYERINFDVSAEHLDFNINYRSSQTILDFSEKSLIAKATKDEDVNMDIKEKIVHLESGFDLQDQTKIEFYQAKNKDEEYDLILSKIQEIVDNDNYLIKEMKNDEYITRHVKLKDIAVLSRKRDFALELADRAIKYGIPANYDGGIELFKTEPALILLAWLRVRAKLDNNRGWLPILEKEGYNYREIETILNSKKYPNNLLNFRSELLLEDKDIISLIEKIFRFHGFSDTYSNAIIVVIGSLFRDFLIPVSDLVNFIEENIEGEETYEVDINKSDDSITIQTIHGAKGLEYPVVFISDVNARRFPPNQSERNTLFFHDLVGLRVKNEFGEKNGYKYVFDKWQTDLLYTKLFSDYDEERRLLYVAITRAKQYLIFTANDKQSYFFEKMSEGFNIIYNYPLTISPIKTEKIYDNDIFKIGEYEKRGLAIGVHDIMQYKSSGDGKGKRFGIELHDFAQKYASGIDTYWDHPKADKIREFIKSLNANEIKVELDCLLPIDDYLVRGKIDLLALYNDRIEIIDYKSDLDYTNEAEYRKQLSVYYHVVRQVYTDKPIYCKIYYVCMDEIKEIDPLSFDEIGENIKIKLKKHEIK
jgi:superfamily I DNA/RNA helicase